MELIKKIINLGELRNYDTPLVYELLTKELKEKGCCTGLNTKQIILQNTEDVINNWGKLDFEYIYLNVFLTQNIDDMGLFTDIEYVDEPVDYTLLFDKFSAFTEPISPEILFSEVYNDPYIRYFARLGGQIESDFYASGGIISALTDSKLYSVTSYNTNTPYIPWPLPGSNLNDYPTQYFTGVDGLFNNYTAYTIDASINNITGTGLHYYTYNFDRLIYNTNANDYFSIPYTTVFYQSEGWNSNNTSLSALTKEEIYFGIVFIPKVENNVFIERGGVSIFEKHSRLDAIDSIYSLEIYGNGYYNIVEA